MKEGEAESAGRGKGNGGVPAARGIFHAGQQITLLLSFLFSFFLINFSTPSIQYPLLFFSPLSINFVYYPTLQPD